MQKKSRIKGRNVKKKVVCTFIIINRNTICFNDFHFFLCMDLISIDQKESNYATAKMPKCQENFKSHAKLSMSTLYKKRLISDNSISDRMPIFAVTFCMGCI